MKKRWLLFLLICLLVVSTTLAGCGGSDDEVQEPGQMEELPDGENGQDEAGREADEDQEEEREPDSGPGPVSFDIEPGFDKHEDRSGYAKLDVTLPLINSSSAEAMKLNGLIDAAFYEEKEMDLDDVAGADYGFVYPWIHVDYDTVELDGIYAVNITTTYTSAEGAGSYQGVQSFYYDGDTDKVISKTEYIGIMGYSKSDIEDLFMEEIGNDFGLPRMSYSDLEQMFYIDSRGNVVFHFAQ